MLHKSAQARSRTELPSISFHHCHYSCGHSSPQYRTHKLLGVSPCCKTDTIWTTLSLIVDIQWNYHTKKNVPLCYDSRQKHNDSNSLIPCWSVNDVSVKPPISKAATGRYCNIHLSSQNSTIDSKGHLKKGTSHLHLAPSNYNENGQQAKWAWNLARIKFHFFLPSSYMNRIHWWTS